MVILDDLTDQRNIGSIIRSCVAFYVDAIFILKKNFSFNNENMNKLKNEMYHAYQFDTFFKEDGIHNFKAYIKSLKKKKKITRTLFGM